MKINMRALRQGKPRPVREGKLDAAVDRTVYAVEDAIEAVRNADIKGAMARATGRAFVRKTEPVFSNAYLGVAPTKLTTGLFTAGAAAYATYGSARAEFRAKAEQSQHDFIGPPPIMYGDGVGNRSNAPTLGASGDLVFGLHNRR